MPTNAHALTRVLLEERGALLRLARRIVRTMAAAEDVTQSLWLRIQQVDRSVRIADPRAYLITLTRHLAFDQRRAEQRRQALLASDTDGQEIADAAPPADRILLDRERLEAVRAALRDLSPRCREILYLRRIEGLTASEIAARLGISRQMVNRYVAQAVRHCLGRIEPDG
ncbi:RNA polymerase sigma factor [Sphingomonas sp. MA1305]|uniref:RNA polymerase sigma factor n=1 Tax=Sphingomonas sp. MA1305 TaxID=2479204 RepID=UPI0018E00BD4|nr:RNA polymerase sigma factor [Sphingomonas sp. MA1305]MBI0475585.1 RNA polymerase sigma factor [Sphingomonas sp. MA1305]